MGKLDGKVAIITGGSGGIGKAAAKLFAEEGGRVLLVDLDADALESAVAEIGADQAACVVADVTDPEQTRAYVAGAVEKFGGVDIALLNAGIEGTIKPITEYETEMFDKVIAVNVRGVFLGLKYVMPAISNRGGGSIVITSSTAGIRGTTGMSAYITSKHAVIGLMRTAALEGAESNIRVNTVNPAPIDTRMMTSIEEQRGLPAGDRSNRPMAQALPLQRYGEPEEVARVMLFLGSEDSSFCTGGVYMVDGGVSAGVRPA
ncbi:MAG: SDR family oxidoreductase [Rhodospirillaceae bacterium]|jgi:NAD(P)-dependent dehydrogenase (short-subunit alcohol dehydrogenase family)|nr:SDR family oxidoreductase [Rhodospirillaceae bacterium]MBT4691126.1 SDR family oxidoreductase [Rhodospirillaceae bacterium]MBT5080645.1 SDR family oxidoreductase [Rhodospirillaceae bacterium]MBT5525073.1 SDR family oxidoreductase [Rhodospirillaceae bacterium]MBT5878043.1 SDR family oxidoreductase [Rhodospirillaceae bacterium]